MRDDVKKFFYDLISHLEEKTNLLNTFLENEKKTSYLIKRKINTEEDVLKIINLNADLIEKIDVEDYNISNIKDEMTRRFSFNFDNFFRDSYYTSETEIMEFKKKILINKNLIKEILDLHKQNNINICIDREDLKQQIFELERMSRIQIIFPENMKS